MNEFSYYLIMACEQGFGIARSVNDVHAHYVDKLTSFIDTL